MIKKHIKHFFEILFSLTFIFAFPISAFATENRIEWERSDCTVTLKPQNTNEDGTSFAKLAFTLYKVADALNEENTLSFHITADFSAGGFTDEMLTDEAAPERMAEYAIEKALAGMVKEADETGTIVFDGLPLGMYLLVLSGNENGLVDCKPFFVMLPYEDSGVWSYDVDASPKMDIVRLVDITVRKVWNKGEGDIPQSVTVQLLDGEQVLDTVTLSEGNQWTYTWRSLPKSDTYSVREIDVPNGYTPSYSKNNDTFTVTNTPALIQTGQLNWPVPLLALSGILLFTLGWALTVLKRKD